jgi:agmatinase
MSLSPLDPAPWTFFGVPSVSDLAALDAQVAFLGVPYDGGTPQPGLPTGQRGGPAAAREASREILDYPEGWYDVESDRDHLTGVTMADVGDVAIQGSDTEANYARMTAGARAIAERGALMVAVGGDHSISFPLGQGMEPLGEFHVVHVDAHADFMDELGGSRLTGGSQLRRLAELPYVSGVSAIGIRNVDPSEIEGLRELGGSWATTLDVVERGPSQVVHDAVPRDKPLYLSVDIDVLDSSIAPGHSLPEPGGLDYRQLRAVLANVARRGRVIGCDVVELNPSRDLSGVTARVTAWIVTHLLSEVFDQPR